MVVDLFLEFFICHSTSTKTSCLTVKKGHLGHLHIYFSCNFSSTNLRWMAPEVFTQCTKYSIKADVFSYALCFWALLAGELPFSHLKPAAAAADMAYRNARPPLHHMMLPEQVERIMTRAWDKTPNDRPAFADIVTDIQGSLQIPGVTGAGNSNGPASNNNDRFRFRRDSTLSVSDL
jgi:serine/threonine protein kinase